MTEAAGLPAQEKSWTSSTPWPDLPQECLQVVLSHCAPRDICRCAAVNRDWREAAASSATWKRHLSCAALLFPILPQLHHAPNALRQFLLLRDGVQLPGKAGSLALDPTGLCLVLRFPSADSLPLHSLGRSIVKFSQEREALGYSGRFGSVLLLWLHQIQALLRPHFALRSGKYVVSVRVRNSPEDDPTDGPEPLAAGRIVLSEMDVRRGRDVRTAMDLFAGMDLLAESPFTDLLMQTRRQEFLGPGSFSRGSSAHRAHHVDAEAAPVPASSSVSQEVLFSRGIESNAAHSGQFPDPQEPSVSGEGKASPLETRDLFPCSRQGPLSVQRVAWTQRLEYSHRCCLHVGYISGEAELVGCAADLGLIRLHLHSTSPLAALPGRQDLL